MPSRADELRTVKKLQRKFCKIKLVTSEGYEFNEKITPFTLLVKAGSVINFIMCSKTMSHSSILIIKISQNDRCLRIFYTNRTDIPPIIQNSAYRPAQICVCVYEPCV